MKRILCVLISALMLFSCVSVTAEEKDVRLGVLQAFGIMEGYGGGDMGLDRYVTRAEFTKMAIAASKYSNAVTSSLSVSPFPDVTYDKWFAPYIYLGVSNGLLAGYKDGTFKPDNHVLYEEGVAILLRLLGYQDNEFAYSWPTGQIGMAERIGLDEGTKAYAGQPLTREQVSYLFYNLLCADTKEGLDYTQTIDRQLVRDITISSSYKQSKSVKKGFVVTNNGTYEVSDDFDYSLVGSKGDAVIKNRKITEFIPKSQTSEEYFVYSVIGNDIILYRDGSMSDLKLSINEKIYFDGAEHTVSSILAMLESGDSINVFYDGDGDILHLVHGESTLEGPYTVSGTPSYINADTQILRKGSKVSADKIEQGDILYYSDTLNMAWVYCDRVTGIYENAFPNQDTPSSVTVSGKSYDIEGITAYKALASNGEASYGDTVTLLLGKDGKVADIISGSSITSNQAVFMVNGGSREYKDNNGNSYSAPYVSVLTEDGVVLDYESKKDYTNFYKNQMAILSFEKGKAVLSEAGDSSLNGIYSHSAKTFGTVKVSDNVKIVDVVKGDASVSAIYKKIYPQRLDDIYISSGKVLYAEKDGEGKITAMFLNDVTGDAYSYGIVTSAENNSAGMNISGSYTYFDGATEENVRTSGKSFTVYAGNAVRIRKNGVSVESITKLTSLGNVTSISDTTVKAGDKAYRYDYDMTIYYHNGNEYQATTKDKFEELSKGKTATAYSEKTDVSSARVRVIVIK